MKLEEWLDDLCVRFIINLPPEELQSVERICFQVEEAQWFYEDFIRPLDPSLPSLSLRAFSLRIFQHCPLFSQWSAQHYTTAFAEFMAYKQRVPVRGAIMLSENMDEVVLVKGWKKGANWSFPRGKINKDEDDLECAIREVYEETGYDVRAAGLVKDPKQMKYIEITMREQHMKLYVFRGVPKDTYFEARTRKEIGKIEWYKLTSLPTQKKHKHQDSNGFEAQTVNANKFYMVAPFLPPLKKWIAQQRKTENRQSSSLAAPPINADDTETEFEHLEPQLPEAQPQPTIASDLPEVTVSKLTDPGAQLLSLFKAEPRIPSPTPLPAPQIPQTDAAKSNALLALLRNDSTAELRASPSTPLYQPAMPPTMAQSSPAWHEHGPPSIPAQQPSTFHVQNPLRSPPQPDIANLRGIPLSPFDEINLSRPAPFALPEFGSSASPLPPNQQMRDPKFTRRQSGQQTSAVPPASPVPQLTSHAKTLLDVFRGASPPRSAKSLSGFAPQTAAAPIRPKEDVSLGSRSSQMAPLQSPHQNKLLQLFGQGGIGGIATSVDKGPVPVELAATPSQESKTGHVNQDEALQALLRQQRAEKPRKIPQTGTFKEGKTAAILNGPHDQPDFQAIPRRTESIEEIGRNTQPSHRTLYDPKQPAPMKIMARPQTPRQAPGKSPRLAKAQMGTASPKRSAKGGAKEVEKPFQPQILRRPQKKEEGQLGATTLEPHSAAMSREQSSEHGNLSTEQPSNGGDAQKATLLSLFGGSPNSGKVSQTPSRVVSPLSMSQLGSPSTEVPLSGIDQISTRSRMGSLASIGTGIMPRPTVEKRQTGAQDKAFLLNYLGRIATQEG